MEWENVTGWVLVRYIIHLYCRAVLDLRSKGPRFDPRPGHGDFFKSS